MAADTIVRQRARKAVESLNDEAEVVGAVLFGSQVDGRVHIWSDVDLAVFVENYETWDLDDEFKAIFKIQREQGNDLEFHFFDAEEWRNAEQASFAEWVIKHGERIS